MPGGITGEHTRMPVAERTMLVRDPVVGTLRQIIAGQEIPPDLIDAEESDVSVVDEAAAAPAEASKAAGKAQRGESQK